jgi:hypothetical protein
MSRYVSSDQTAKVVESHNEEFLSSILIVEDKPKSNKSKSTKKKSKKA